LRRRESDREDFDRLLNADPAGAENGVQLEDSFLRHSSARWQALNDRIAGDVIQPDSPDYATARKPALARFGYVRPQAIVRCQTPVDVAMTLELARDLSLPVAPRSGGHSFAGRSTTSGVVIDLSPMTSTSLQEGLAVVGAGTLLGELYDSLSLHGRTIPAGCGPTVGIAGLTLGGGLGILGRKYGLTADHLLGAQVVLADGRVLDCDDHHDRELFWALRGAGHGQFGIVTSLTFRTVPTPACTAFHLTWPIVHAAGIVQAWQSWAPAAADEMAASLLVTAPENLDEPPVVHLFGAMLGSQSETDELLEELPTPSDPVSVIRRAGSHRAAKRYLAEHGPGDQRPEGHAYSKSEFFTRLLPASTISALIDHLATGRIAGVSRELDFTPWGGAYNRVPADATAFPHRQARFLLKHAVVVPADAASGQRREARDWLTKSWAAVTTWGNGGVYPNFPDDELDHPGRRYYGVNFEYLTRVKARYDPGEYLPSNLLS
jgi:FAD/FMN-containing dehydrogenase